MFESLPFLIFLGNCSIEKFALLEMSFIDGVGAVYQFSPSWDLALWELPHVAPALV